MKARGPLSVQLQTHDFLSLLDFPDLTFEVESLGWEAIGGPIRSEIKVYGEREQLYALVDHLRAPVEIFNGEGKPIWWGYLHEAIVQEGALERGATLSGMANYIAVAWDGGTEGQQKTAWVQDSASLGRYGRKEKLAATTRRAEGEAEMLRDNLLATFGNPLPVLRHSGSESDEIVATLSCRGWWDTLDWRYYSRGKLTQEYFPTLANWRTAITFCDQRFDVGAVFQRFTYTGTQVGYLEAVAFIFNAGGSAVDLNVALLDSQGNTLATGTSRPGPWNEFFDIELRTAGGLRQALTPNATYTLKLWSSVTAGRSWTAIPAALAGSALTYWHQFAEYEVTTNVTLMYRVTLFLEGGQHIALAEESCGEFITATDILTDTGLQTDAEVAGDQKCKTFIEEILTNGTLNNRRLLATVTRQRRLRIDEQPIAAADDAPYLLRRDGKIEDRLGNLVGAENVAGQWCVAKDRIPSLSAVKLVDPNLCFIERADWNRSDDTLMIEPAGVPGVFDLLEFQEE